MNRADAILLAQIIRTMTDLVRQLDKAKEDENSEKFEALRREIMILQRKIDSII